MRRAGSRRSPRPAGLCTPTSQTRRANPCTRQAAVARRACGNGSRCPRARPAAGALQRAPTKGLRLPSSASWARVGAHSGAIVAPDEELGAHATPFALDLVEAREHGVQIACRRGGLGLLAERRELSGPERPAVALQRVRRTPGTGRVAGGCGAAQRLELGWSVLEELVDELGDEHRVVAHALAQLIEDGVVDCAFALRHGS